ncbi:efflux RND transporter permease subunit [Niveibacterium terrae]|uniref:efflux RND transporter permease subunit n=1 Tax=Niveibacterium terrae TaxID=3373598 RepID=UPI003A923DF0
MFSQFFIRRPIFATVIAIIIVIAGIVAARVLPIAQYPEIAPPTVQITASYPGASAETLARTVAAPIEEQLNGVEGLLYFQSSASSNGSLSITATFETGTNADMAAVNVNNKVRAVETRLPDTVRQNGVLVQKRSNDILLMLALRSSDGKKDSLYLSNYATLNMVDEIKRIKGVGDVNVFGSSYAMRVWLKPDRMAQLGVTASDIATAISGQNVQFAAGKIGASPSQPGQSLVYTVTARGRLIDPGQFGNIIVRGDSKSGILRLRDVARVELGGQSYDVFTQLDGKPSSGMAVYLQTGANALDTANAVKAWMAGYAKKLPQGIDYSLPYDTSTFVQSSINEVVQTLLEAALLVIVVVYVFLQSWRATLIPVLAVPVSLIGTFAGLWLFGFSINTLTLFAMVLAIGIVVDDAIVVLENVERLMSEQGLSPREAAKEAMREVSSAVVAIVLVLCAVFVPVAFLGGIAGQLYKQFAVTVAVSVVISGLVALTLTPALCALLLKPQHSEPAAPFRWFNAFFDGLTKRYTGTVGLALHHRIVSALVFIGVIAIGTLLILRIPGSFVPAEDQGVVFASVMLPDGASLERTASTAEAVRRTIAKNPAIAGIFVVNGYDMIGGGNKTNAATVFVRMKPWEERKLTSEELVKQIMGAGMMQPDGLAISFNPPAIRGLGTAGGFEAFVQSRGTDDPKKLAVVMGQFIEALKDRKELAGINTFFRPSAPQLHVEVDEEKAQSLGVPVASVFTSLQSMMGSLYVNDFNKYGRTYRVQIQADAAYRMKPEDLGHVWVRSDAGDMIPLSSLIKVERTTGAEVLDRYNGFLAAKLMGGAAPGVSSGEAIRITEEVAEKVLPAGYELAWTGQAYQEKRAGSSSANAFVFALIMVFLILAAQFERWSLPLAVVMAVPFALLGALVAILFRGFPNDIYFQIGLVTLIGLAAKNAILIVEFAEQQMETGKSVLEAAQEAARLRFRPIVMTSLAFVLGVVPLVIATGAGAAARRSMGTGVFGGMIAATFIATIFIPVFFTWLAGKKPRHHDEKPASGEKA